MVLVPYFSKDEREHLDERAAIAEFVHRYRPDSAVLYPLPGTTIALKHPYHTINKAEIVQPRPLQGHEFFTK